MEDGGNHRHTHTRQTLPQTPSGNLIYHVRPKLFRRISEPEAEEEEGDEGERRSGGSEGQ